MHKIQSFSTVLYNLSLSANNINQAPKALLSPHLMCTTKLHTSMSLKRSHRIKNQGNNATALQLSKPRCSWGQNFKTKPMVIILIGDNWRQGAKQEMQALLHSIFFWTYRKLAKKAHAKKVWVSIPIALAEIRLTWLSKFVQHEKNQVRSQNSCLNFKFG